MIGKRKILAVIPARGGSKGIKRKNLQEINGESLVGIAVKCARLVEEIDAVIVSTDSEEIGSEGQKKGARFPFLRPKEFASDTATDFALIKHALEEMENIDLVKYDVVVLLQPTSPSRSPEHVRAVLNFLIEKNYDAVWTLSKTDSKYHPRKQINVKDGLVTYWHEDGIKMLPRQNLEQLYHVNGIAYALTRECITKQKSRFGKRTGAFIIKDEVVNIDTLEDLELARMSLSKRANSPGPD
tara:strand:- start:242 stop:964 length:723 start_codon:yes stop_codon:yes gene_type:complete